MYKNLITFRRTISVNSTIVDDPMRNAEKTPLLGSPDRTVDVECEDVSCGGREALEESELHKAKDFQLIRVPKGAVSFR